MRNPVSCTITELQDTLTQHIGIDPLIIRNEHFTEIETDTLLQVLEPTWHVFNCEIPHHPLLQAKTNRLTARNRALHVYGVMYHDTNPDAWRALARHHVTYRPYHSHTWPDQTQSVLPFLNPVPDCNPHLNQLGAPWFHALTEAVAETRTRKQNAIHYLEIPHLGETHLADIIEILDAIAERIQQHTLPFQGIAVSLPCRLETIHHILTLMHACQQYAGPLQSLIFYLELAPECTELLTSLQPHLCAAAESAPHILFDLHFQEGPLSAYKPLQGQIQNFYVIYQRKHWTLHPPIPEYHTQGALTLNYRDAPTAPIQPIPSHRKKAIAICHEIAQHTTAEIKNDIPTATHQHTQTVALSPPSLPPPPLRLGINDINMSQHITNALFGADIHWISELAFKEISRNPLAYAGGVSTNTLPAGFIILIDEAAHKGLHFDRTLLDIATRSPLMIDDTTPSQFGPHRNWKGTVEQFLTHVDPTAARARWDLLCQENQFEWSDIPSRITDELKAALIWGFFQTMILHTTAKQSPEGMTEVDINHFHAFPKPFSTAIENFDIKGHYIKLAHTLYEGGAPAYNACLDFFAEYYAKTEDTYSHDWFFNCLLVSYDDWLTLLTDENKTAFNTLHGFTSQQKAWFYALTRQHLTYCGPARLTHWVDAFSYFLHEFEKIEPGLSHHLPDSELFTHNHTVCSLPVTLDRILITLRQSQYPNTQLALFDKTFDFSSQGFIYAIECGYRFVFDSMQLNSHHATEIDTFSENEPLPEIMGLTPEQEEIVCSRYLGRHGSLPHFVPYVIMCAYTSLTYQQDSAKKQSLIHLLLKTASPHTSTPISISEWIECMKRSEHMPDTIAALIQYPFSLTPTTSQLAEMMTRIQRNPEMPREKIILSVQAIPPPTLNAEERFSLWIDNILYLVIQAIRTLKTQLQSPEWRKRNKIVSTALSSDFAITTAISMCKMKSPALFQTLFQMLNIQSNQLVDLAILILNNATEDKQDFPTVRAIFKTAINTVLSKEHMANPDQPLAHTIVKLFKKLWDTAQELAKQFMGANTTEFQKAQKSLQEYYTYLNQVLTGILPTLSETPPHTRDDSARKTLQHILHTLGGFPEIDSVSPALSEKIPQEDVIRLIGPLQPLHEIVKENSNYCLYYRDIMLLANEQSPIARCKMLLDLIAQLPIPPHHHTLPLRVYSIFQCIEPLSLETQSHILRFVLTETDRDFDEIYHFLIILTPDEKAIQVFLTELQHGRPLSDILPPINAITLLAEDHTAFFHSLSEYNDCNTFLEIAWWFLNDPQHRTSPLVGYRISLLLHIFRLTCAQYPTEDQTNILYLRMPILLADLSRLAPGALITLYQLYQTTHFQPPFNALQDLLRNAELLQTESIRTWYLSLTGKRNKTEQFDTDQTEPVINNMIDCVTKTVLPISSRQAIHEAFEFVNELGHHYPLSGLFRPICDLLPDEIQVRFQQNKNQLRDPNENEIEHRIILLECLSLAREMMYRTTGLFANSTQMLAVLDCLLTPHSTLLEMQTGEGKSMTIALLAALKGLQHDEIHICTLDPALAARDSANFHAFYQSFSFHVAVITPESPLSICQLGGIFYSEPGSLSLFNVRRQHTMVQSPTRVLEHPHPVVIFDEVDHLALDDMTQYRLAEFEKEARWMYDMIFEFVQQERIAEASRHHSETLLHNFNVYLQRTLENDSGNADLKNWEAFLSDSTWNEKIHVLLCSAFTARDMEERIDFSIIEKHDDQGNTHFAIPYDYILRPKPSATFGNGVHIFLHMWLNVKNGNLGKRFPILPATRVTTSIGSRDLLRHCLERGHIFGFTGTLGSDEECNYLSHEYGLVLHHIPPHYPNIRTDHTIVVYGHKPGSTEELTLPETQDFQHMLRYKIQCALDKEMPILISVHTIPTAHALTTLIQHHFREKTIICYCGEDISETKQTEQRILEQAGLPHTITISTVFGRGADIIPHSEQGLCVICVGVATHRKTRQLHGRAGRQGDAGESYHILTAEEIHALLPTTPSHPLPHVPMPTAEHITQAVEKLDMIDRESRVLRDQFMDVRFILYRRRLWLTGLIEAPEVLAEWYRLLNDMELRWNQLSLSPSAHNKVLLAEFVHRRWQALLSKVEAQDSLGLKLLQHDALTLKETLLQSLARPLETQRVIRPLFAPAAHSEKMILKPIYRFYYANKASPDTFTATTTCLDEKTFLRMSSDQANQINTLANAHTPDWHTADSRSLFLFDAIRQYDYSPAGWETLLKIEAILWRNLHKKQAPLPLQKRHLEFIGCLLAHLHTNPNILLENQFAPTSPHPPGIMNLHGYIPVIEDNGISEFKTDEPEIVPLIITPTVRQLLQTKVSPEADFLNCFVSGWDMIATHFQASKGHLDFNNEEAKAILTLTCHPYERILTLDPVHYTYQDITPTPPVHQHLPQDTEMPHLAVHDTEPSLLDHISAFFNSLLFPTATTTETHRPIT